MTPVNDVITPPQSHILFYRLSSSKDGTQTNTQTNTHTHTQEKWTVYIYIMSVQKKLQRIYGELK